MSGLQPVSGDGGYEPCVHCGALAVGPCARCQAPVCGDCCVLTEGGTRVYAICLGCNERGGRSLKASWMVVLGWFVVPILLVAAALLVLGLAFR